jgi:hypothetical protein
MPYLTITKGAPATGQSFEATLCDERRPVTAKRVSEFWILIGQDDWRQVMSVWATNGVTTVCVLPSRLNAAAQARAKRLAEAVAAGRALLAALAKLDVADRGPATKMLSHQLGHWLETPQSAPVEPPARQGEPDRRAAPSMAIAPAGSKG